jgi:hypothetical protein
MSHFQRSFYQLTALCGSPVRIDQFTEQFSGLPRILFLERPDRRQSSLPLTRHPLPDSLLLHSAAIVVDFVLFGNLLIATGRRFIPKSRS